MKLSIIIPLYNNKKYIGICIKSCLNQGIEEKDYEIIIVNDASTDSGDEEVNRYIEKNKNIHLINHEINKGPEQSRLTGLLKARGEYVFFVDSDDWLTPNILYAFVENADKNGYDLVCGQRRTAATIGKLRIFSKTIPLNVCGEIARPESIDKYWISFFGQSLIPIFFTGSMIRKTCIPIECFSAGMRFWEDQYEMLCTFQNLNKAYYSSEVVYNYRLGGMTSSFNKRIYTDHKTLFRLRLNKIDETGYEKGRYYACGEMKNVFKEVIKEMIRDNTYTKEETIDFISEELNDSIWNDVLVPEYLRKFKNQDFTNSLVAKDANAIYNICENESKQNGLKRLRHRIWNSVFR